jgi:hypothetical protein
LVEVRVGTRDFDPEPDHGRDHRRSRVKRKYCVASTTVAAQLPPHLKRRSRMVAVGA